MKRVIFFVACCLLSVVAQSAELSFKVKSKYLNLPISQDAERRKLTFQATDQRKHSRWSIRRTLFVTLRRCIERGIVRSSTLRRGADGSMTRMVAFGMTGCIIFIISTILLSANGRI